MGCQEKMGLRQLDKTPFERHETRRHAFNPVLVACWLTFQWNQLVEIETFADRLAVGQDSHMGTQKTTQLEIE